MRCLIIQTVVVSGMWVLNIYICTCGFKVNKKRKRSTIYTLSPSDYLILPIKIIHSDIFRALAGLNPQEACRLHGVLPVVPQNCAFMLACYLVREKGAE